MNHRSIHCQDACDPRAEVCPGCSIRNPFWQTQEYEPDWQEIRGPLRIIRYPRDPMFKADLHKMRCKRDDPSAKEGPQCIDEKYQLAREHRLQWTEYEKRSFMKKHRDQMSKQVAQVLDGVQSIRTWEMYSMDRWKYDRNLPPSKPPRGFEEFKKKLRLLNNDKWNPNFSAKRRHQLAWKYGCHLSKKLMCKLLKCPARPKQKKVRKLVKQDKAKQRAQES